MSVPISKTATVASLVVLVVSGAAQAQPAAATLLVTVSTSSQAVLPDAIVSVRNPATGEVTERRTDANGACTVSRLPPGEYDVSISADGFESRTERVTLVPGATRSVMVALAASPAGLSLGALGFSPQETQGSAAQQARLDRRSHMLKIHQRLGLITAVPMVASLLTSHGARGRHGTQSGRNLHAALGGLTAGLYAATASFAILAPKIPGTEARGPIRLHKTLAWIHGTGMVLTPILGAMAYRQLNRGERVHGIAQAHAAAAAVTIAAYGLAVVSVSVKF